MHGIGGSSSGAIAAFTVAWERPDQFRKVLSNVGSFVNLRGGHVYPEKVRRQRQEADPRLPVRRPQRQPRPRTRRQVRPEAGLVLSERPADEGPHGEGLRRELLLGHEQHGQKFGGAILPEMMRWLWRDDGVSTDPHDMTERSANRSKKQQ